MKNSMRLCWPLLLLACLWGPAIPAEQSDMATERVRDTTGRILEILRERKVELEASPNLIFGLVDEIVIPNFDFRRITSFAMGKHWREATPAQRDDLVEAFQQMLIRTYAKALLTYSGQDIQFLPVRPGKRAGQVTVRTEVQNAGAPSVPINYQMYLKGSEWKVYDVNIDGVSLVSNYRSSFSSQIRRGGVDGLIRALQARNGNGEGGA